MNPKSMKKRWTLPFPWVAHKPAGRGMQLRVYSAGRLTRALVVQDGRVVAELSRTDVATRSGRSA